MCSSMEQVCLVETLINKKIVAQSIAEAEYIAAATALNQAIWFKKLLVYLWQNQKEPTDFFCDN